MWGVNRISIDRNRQPHAICTFFTLPSKWLGYFLASVRYTMKTSGHPMNASHDQQVQTGIILVV
jgi:hypothetical protein